MTKCSERALKIRNLIQNKKRTDESLAVRAVVGDVFAGVTAQRYEAERPGAMQFGTLEINKNDLQFTVNVTNALADEFMIESLMNPFFLLIPLPIFLIRSETTLSHLW